MDRDTELHIINILRQGTVTWRGRSECLKKASNKKFIRFGLKGQKIYKTYWTCGICEKEYRDVDMLEVDHIDEIGSFRGDFDVFVRRMYCEQDNLMAVCIVCHKRKTAKFNSASSLYKRK